MNSPRERRSDGGTLIELASLLLMFVFGLVGGMFGYGYIHSWVGWLIGFVAGIMFFFVGVAGLVLWMDFWMGGVPRLPKCRNGCCRGLGLFGGKDDYKSEKFGDKYVRVCKCGGRYRRKGRRFVIVNEDGSETSYLIWRSFRGWYPDTAK